MQVIILDGVVCFKFPEEAAMDLLNILLAVTPKVPDLLFDKVLRTPPQVVVKRFDVNINTEELILLITAPKGVILGDGLLELEKAEFELKHKKNGIWEFKIEAIKSIAGTTMDIVVKKVGDEYIFKG